MNRISRCDWLPERARWSYLARSGNGFCPARKMAFCVFRWLFCVFKQNLANIQPSWPHAWSITHIYSRKRTTIFKDMCRASLSFWSRELFAESNIRKQEGVYMSLHEGNWEKCLKICEFLSLTGCSLIAIFLPGLHFKTSIQLSFLQWVPLTEFLIEGFFLFLRKYRRHFDNSRNWWTQFWHSLWLPGIYTHILSVSLDV